MNIGIASKYQPFARRANPDGGSFTTIPPARENGDLFGGWGPKA